MKRIIATILALALVGCGQKNPATSKEDTTAATQAQPVPYHVRPLGTTASDWRIIRVSGTRPLRQVEMMDFKSLVTSGDSRQIWLARVREDKGNISYGILLYDYNCKNQTVKLKKSAYTNGKDNELIISDHDGKEDNVIPGTAGVLYLDYVCKKNTSATIIPNSIDPINYIKGEFLTITRVELFNIAAKALEGEEGISESVYADRSNKVSKVLELYNVAASNSGKKDIIDNDADVSIFKAMLSKNIADKVFLEKIFSKLGI